MGYLQMTMEDYLQEKQEIRHELEGMVKSFVKAGWHLSRIDRSGAYKLDGYSSITEFASREYGMTATGVTRFIEVYEKYSADGDTPELKDQYKDFNFSQLTEMLQIPEAEHVMFEPEAKREAIREYRAYTKENEASPDRLLNWQQEPGDAFGAAVLEFFKQNRDIMDEFFGSRAYAEGNEKDMVEILNASGNRSFRHKTVFIMMYSADKGCMVNEFGGNPQKIQWAEFIAKTKEIFGDLTGPDAWERCFGDQIPGQDNIMNHPEYMLENGEAAAISGANGQKTDESAALSGGNLQDSDENGQENAPNVQTTLPDGQKALPDGQKHGQVNKETMVMGGENQPEEGDTSVPEEISGHQIIGIAPAQKKDPYEAEQARIDRETKKKLQEMEDEEKMAHLPSETRKVHSIRLASSYYDDVAEGRKTFELRKNDRGYRLGHTLKLMEFKDGRHTGRMIHADIVYMLEDYTGLEDGYCILGIHVTDYT